MDWTPTGTETVVELEGRLHAAGLKTQAFDDVPRGPRGAMASAGARGVSPNAVPGLSASEGVKAMIDAFEELKAKGLSALAAKVATYPVVLVRGESPSTIMGTTGHDGAQEGELQWFTVNTDLTPVLIDPEPQPGEPWGIRDAREALRAGEVSPREANQQALDAAAVHEFGHALDSLTGSELSENFTSTVVSAAGGWDEAAAWTRSNVSRYAGSSPREGTAEAFSRAVYGAPLPSALQAWGDDALGEARTGSAWR